MCFLRIRYVQIIDLVVLKSKMALVRSHIIAITYIQSSLSDDDTLGFVDRSSRFEVGSCRPGDLLSLNTRVNMFDFFLVMSNSTKPSPLPPFSRCRTLPLSAMLVDGFPVIYAVNSSLSILLIVCLSPNSSLYFSRHLSHRMLLLLLLLLLAAFLPFYFVRLLIGVWRAKPYNTLQGLDKMC